jgi:hypothetical protein
MQKKPWTQQRHFVVWFETGGCFRPLWSLGRWIAIILAPLIVDLLGSPTIDVHRTAANVLSQFKYQPAIPLLIVTLAHPNLTTRVASANALGILGGEAALAALRDRCPKAVVDEYQILFSAIGMCGAAGAGVLTETITTGSADERYWAIAGIPSDDLSSQEELLRSLPTDETRTSSGKQVGTAARSPGRYLI